MEDLRWRLDPVQAGLIAAHATLCREDELEPCDPDRIGARVRSAPFASLELGFGGPARSGGHGILLPCTEGREAFRELRRHLLGDPGAREQSPHLTLAHPRNPRASGNRADRLPEIPIGWRFGGMRDDRLTGYAAAS